MKLIDGTKFVNDEQVVGKWEYVDIVKSEQDFNLNKLNLPNFEKGFKEIYFMPNGAPYWVFEGWSKGLLLVDYGGDEPLRKCSYEIKDFSGDLYMFLCLENEYNEKFIEVLKKVSSKHFKLEDFIIKENIDLPFVYDEKIIGKWKSVGFVENIEDFNENTDYSNDLWLKTIVFKENGEVVRKYFNGKEWKDNWTNGKLLDKAKNVVSNYTFKLINNVEFMFMEWKMGNYIYAGIKPDYYVFTRSEN